MDATVADRLESLRVPELRSADGSARQRKTIQPALDFAEAGVRDLEAPRHIGPITTACTLAYLDFRLLEEAWRGMRSGLGAWYGRFSEHPSIKDTCFPSP